MPIFLYDPLILLTQRVAYPSNCESWVSIDEEGFPKQSKVWEGNVSEPDTLKEQRFEQELLAIKAGLGKTKRQKRYDTIIERTGRLKERYKVGNLYTIKVEQADGKAIDLQFEKNDQAQAKEDATGTGSITDKPA